jgi:hypothetical protein
MPIALRPLATAALLSLISAAAGAQQPTPPVSQPEPLPPPAAAAPAAPAASRVFCGQSVNYRLADPTAAPDTYRAFVGIFSDAAWTPQLCAALIVENVAADGTATIAYAFGPIGSGNAKPGGVLHGTGVVQDGELKFQNADGSQYGFKPFYSDLDGRWTTPKGETYEAIFKKTF